MNDDNEVKMLEYLFKWKRANGIEDLLRAKWYLDKLIDELTDK